MRPPRAREFEDMRVRELAEASQEAHIRTLSDLTAFLGRAPDTATPDIPTPAHNAKITSRLRPWQRSKKGPIGAFRT